MGLAAMPSEIQNLHICFKNLKNLNVTFAGNCYTQKKVEFFFCIRKPINS